MSRGKGGAPSRKNNHNFDRRSAVRAHKRPFWKTRESRPAGLSFLRAKQTP
jgi:hypothetical protein